MISAKLLTNQPALHATRLLSLIPYSQFHELPKRALSMNAELKMSSDLVDSLSHHSIKKNKTSYY